LPLGLSQHYLHHLSCHFTYAAIIKRLSASAIVAPTLKKQPAAWQRSQLQPAAASTSQQQPSAPTAAASSGNARLSNP